MGSNDEGKLDDDVFVEAFDQAEANGDKPDLSAADDPDKVQEGEKTPKELQEADAQQAEDQVKANEAAEADRIAQEAEAAKQKPNETDAAYEQRWKTLQGIHKHDKEAWEAEKAALLEQIEAAKKPQEPEPAKTDAFMESLTEEQKEALKEYEADFDVVSKMEGIKRQAELDKLRKEFQAWKDEVTAQLVPAAKLVTETQTEREARAVELHFKTIRDAHEDFEKYRDDGSVLKWIETKPKYMQKSMLETYQQGTADDIVDLLTDFKTENNLAPQGNVVNMNSRKADKKAALSAVNTRRGAVNASMSVANDYEGAFDEALNK